MPSSCGGSFLRRGLSPGLQTQVPTRAAQPGARGHGPGAGRRHREAARAGRQGCRCLGAEAGVETWPGCARPRGGTIPDRPDPVPPGWGLIHTGAGTSEPPGEDTMSSTRLPPTCTLTLLGTSSGNGDLPRNAQPAGKAPREGADPNCVSDSFRNLFVTSDLFPSQPWSKVSPASGHSAGPEQNKNEMQSWRAEEPRA